MYKKVILLLATLMAAFVLCGAVSAADLSVTKTDPGNNTNNVKFDKVISVTFNSPISKSDASKISLKTQDKTKQVPTISGTSLTNGNKTLLIKHSVLLTDTTYILSLTQIQGLSTYIKFKTDSLRVTGTEPGNNTIDIPTTKLIKVAFTRYIYSPNKSLIKLETYSDHVNVPVTYSIKGNAIYIDHSPLNKYRTYLLTIKPNFLKDSTGAGSQTYSFRFKTGETNLNHFEAVLRIPKLAGNPMPGGRYPINPATMDNYRELYHYKGSAYYGTPGLCGLIGHRTTHGAPMRHIDNLVPGDLIIIEDHSAGKISTYRVTGHVIQYNEDIPKTFAHQGESRIQLRSCYPVGSSYMKYIVYGTLVSTLPLE